MEESVAPPLPPKTKHRFPLHHRPDHPTVPPSAVAPAPVLLGPLVDVLPYDNTRNHVVKILIDPQNDNHRVVNSTASRTDYSTVGTTVNICFVNPDVDMIPKGTVMDKGQENYFYYGSYNFGVMSSGQVSPSDTLDSGTCSDLDGTPPLPTKKKNGVSVTLIGSHKRAPSSSSGAEVDSDDNESSSSISCDSLTSGKVSPIDSSSLTAKSAYLPATLLQDIRQRNSKLISSPKIDQMPYEDRKKETEEKKNVVVDPDMFPDMFYKFHMNENEREILVQVNNVVDNETFAGYRDVLGEGAATIRSAKGTVRGVKNRVRAGNCYILADQHDNDKVDSGNDINSSNMRVMRHECKDWYSSLISDARHKCDMCKSYQKRTNYKEKEAGKVVVYTTTMGVLRDTYQACTKVKQILRTLLAKFEERDVFMSCEYQNEIKERMHCDHILVPQLFVNGQHIGDAETVERLNETGELRRIMKPFKSMDVCTTCQACGGYRLLPCQICKGSKKSVHRNHFTAEFVALKCMNCDEVGLVRCSFCS